MKILLPLNWLLAFEVSAHHLNFRYVADGLKFTQTAICKLTLNLEYSLFMSVPRELELSHEGI